MPLLPRRTFLKSLTVAAVASQAAGSNTSWPTYGGNPGVTRYSPLSQINKENIGKLLPAWVHHCGDSMTRPATTIEAEPLVVGGKIYVTTAQVKVRALDAASGSEEWTFDPFGTQTTRRNRGVCRGLTYWQDGKRERIFAAVLDRVYSIDLKTGEPDDSFGENGSIDLKQGLDRDISGLSYSHTSPVLVHKDLIITGGGGGEGPSPQSPGHIRAWDVRTGKRHWIFHTLPHPGEYGYNTWPKDAYERVGGVNNWCGMSLDSERNIVFVALGSAAFDFYGGDRAGQNLFANCILALDVESGERVWHYQTVHHDVWDYDLPCPPILIHGRINGKSTDAVAQFTKTGMLFLLDRDTGKPLFEVEERAVPQGGVPGEVLWPTQPFPTKPQSLSVHGFTDKEVTNRTPKAEADVRGVLNKARSDGIFTPPGFELTVVRPGFNGGVLWGGGSYDPERNLLIVSSSENSNLLQLHKAEADKPYRYAHDGWVRFLDQDGYPAAKPPWGHLTAIDPDSGEFVWRVVLGEHENMPQSGTLVVGGPVATAGGLTFIGATQDEKFRAFDSDTGKILWEHQLNAGGYANACTYMLNGVQYVAISAGGAGKNRTKPGDEIVAFSLDV